MQALAVERAVQRVYLDYCDVIDEKRFDDLDQVFTADCVGPVDETHACAQVRFYAVHRGTGTMAGTLYTVWGRYDDELRLTGDGWRIVTRRYTNYVVDGDKAVIRCGEPQPSASVR